MIQRIHAEDIISIIVEDLNSTTEIMEVKYGKINSFRNNLRMQGILHELDYYELNSLAKDYPENIIMGDTSLEIKRTDSFVEIFESRKSRYSEGFIKFLMQLWEM